MSSATVTTVAKGHSTVKSVKKSSTSSSSPTDHHHHSSHNDSNSNFRRSYKKKDNCVSLVDVDNPELGLKTSIERSENIPPSPSTTSTKVGWKNSKIFSRTLSSIEVIRAMKSKSSSSTSNSLTTSPINPSSSSTDSPIPSIYYGDRLGRSSPSSAHPSPSPPPPPSSHPASLSSSSSNSKTSAMTSNQENEGNSAARRSKAQSEWKTLKSKLSSLRKKSSSNSDDNCVDNDNNNNNDDRSNRRTSGSNKGSARTSRSGSQDEGIVCKREDLINLLYEAARAAASNSRNRKNSPEPNEPTSPSGGTSRKSVLSPKNTSSNISVSIGQSVTTAIVPTSTTTATTTTTGGGILSSMNSTQGTPSLSPKVSKKSALKKNTTSEVRVKIDESNVDFVETKIIVPPLKSALKHDTNSDGQRSMAKNRSGRSNSGRESKNLGIKTTFREPGKRSDHTSPTSSSHSPSDKIPVAIDNSSINYGFDECGDENRNDRLVMKVNDTCHENGKEVAKNVIIRDESEKLSKLKVMEKDCSERCSVESIEGDADGGDGKDAGEEGDENLSEPVDAAVKWDEENVVDAFMLGDAIQAFLRGMGGPPAKPAPVKPPEKRVLFKRNS
ncbi:uncharacterized protein LOC141852665 [Brevipalpus obovatus]|uniref:uncharacterized protein LOC141852665 n=1 Tax=Brevipalpus obovatus TaxID=246614 RepID=UPI003D9E72D5